MNRTALAPYVIGGIFCTVLGVTFGLGLKNYIANPPTPTAEEVYHLPPTKLALASDGALGRFDRAQLRRGFEVYRQVCSNCHSLKFVAFRNLQEIGYTEAQVKDIASQWSVPQPAIDPATGAATTRPSLPADHFAPPFANNEAARAANNNAVPPDLSLMTKAREGGAAYVHALLTGYRDAPADLARRFPQSATPATSYYNPYFANLNIAMPPPLVEDGQVTYPDGHQASVDQMAKDVAAFLVWTAEPRLEERKQIGLGVMLFLALLTVTTILAYRRIAASAL